MIVAYSWKLNANVIFKKDARVMEVIEERELPTAIASLGDIRAVQQRWAASLCDSAAGGEREAASAAESSGDLRQASRRYQWAAAYVERFDGQEALSFSADCYRSAARCELSLGLPILAVHLLRQVAVLRARTGASELDGPLLSKALAEDEATLHRLERLAYAATIRTAEATAAVDYLLLRPTRKRARMARLLVDRLPREEPERAILLARCAAATGDLSGAIAVIDAMRSPTREATRWRDEWHSLSEGEGLHVARPVFGHPRDEHLASLAERVNRGFTLLANALYFEALAWFMNALHRDRLDPFALFGYGLTSWRMGAFGPATRSLEVAIAALSAYSRDYRWLSFVRDDPTSEARSYQENPIYPIFNMQECLARAARCESFVRHDILP